MVKSAWSEYFHETYRVSMIWQEEQNRGVDVYIIVAADSAATMSTIIRVMAIHPPFLMIRPVPSDVTVQRSNGDAPRARS